MYIRKLQEDRLKDAVKVITRAFNNVSLARYARQDLGYSFAKVAYKPTTFAAFERKKLIGTIQVIPQWIDFASVGIAWVAVDPDHQRSGVGKALIAHAERFAQKTFWHGGAGSIMLVDAVHRQSPTDESYYARLGYAAGPALHHGEPIMIKNLPALT